MVKGQSHRDITKHFIFFFFIKENNTLLLRNGQN